MMAYRQAGQSADWSVAWTAVYLGDWKVVRKACKRAAAWAAQSDSSQVALMVGSTVWTKAAL